MLLKLSAADFHNISDNRLETDYILYNGNIRYLFMQLNANDGYDYNIGFRPFSSGDNMLFDLGWQPQTTCVKGALSNTAGFTGFKIRIRRSDDENITPDCIDSLIFGDYQWAEKGYYDLPKPCLAKPNDFAWTQPIPLTVWRIDPTKFGGRVPVTGLMLVRGRDMWSLKRETAVIRVYDMTEPKTGFDHNGLAILMPISCRTTYNDDVWEVNLVHPLDEWGKWKTLRPQNVLKVDGQLFRIDIVKPECSDSGGSITVHAKHITEDMADVLIEEATFGSGTALDFMGFCFANVMELPSRYHGMYDFDYYSDIDTELSGGDYENVTLWGAMVGIDNCLMNRYGGKLYRNNFYFSICKKMEGAKENAFRLRYSLDMVKITQEIDYTDFCTDLVCKDNFGNVWVASYTGSENWIIHHPKQKIYKFHYSDADEASRLFWTDARNLWLRVNHPKVTYDVQLASIRNDPRYADFADLQNYRKGDSGTIYCPELDILTTQEITEVVKDELTGDIISVKLGNLGNSFIRPSYMGSTISTGNTLADKQNEDLQNAIIGTGIARAEQYPVKRLEQLTVAQLQGE